MATYYCKPGITAGTGSGTIGDPWNIQDTLSASNINGIAAGDQIAIMTDGVTWENVTASLSNPTTIARLSVFPVDFSGNPTTNRWMIDGTSLGSGNLLNIVNLECSFFFGHLRNSPGYGIVSSSNDRGILKGMIVEDSTLDGIRLASGADQVRVYDTIIKGSGQYGFYSNESTDYPFVKNMYIEHNSTSAAFWTFGEAVDVMVELDATGLSSFSGIELGTQTGWVTANRCTVVITGDTSSLTAGIHACYYWNNTTANRYCSLYDCIADLQATDRASIYAYRFGSAAIPVNFKGNVVDTGFGNVYFNKPTGSAGYNWSDATVIDPQIPLGGDMGPATDLTTYSTVNQYAEEASGKRGSGAVPLFSGGGGGGGLSLFGGDLLR